MEEEKEGKDGEKATEMQVKIKRINTEGATEKERGKVEG